jgi:hypothetical protein
VFLAVVIVMVISGLVFSNEKVLQETADNNATPDFNKAFELADKFLNLLQQSKWDEAQRLCGDDYAKKEVVKLSRDNGQNYYPIKNYHIYKKKHQVRDNGIEFYDGEWTGAMSLTVSNVNGKLKIIQFLPAIKIGRR